MGYWATKLIWGDSPADELDACLDEVFDILGRVPSDEELLDMFALATAGAASSPAVCRIQDGLSSAINVFHADWERDPSPAELHAGFLFALSSLDLAQDLQERSARPVVGEPLSPPATC